MAKKQTTEQKPATIMHLTNENIVEYDSNELRQLLISVLSKECRVDTNELSLDEKTLLALTASQKIDLFNFFWTLSTVANDYHILQIVRLSLNLATVSEEAKQIDSIAVKKIVTLLSLTSFLDLFKSYF